MTDSLGRSASLLDASDYAEVESKAGVIYDVSFGNTDSHAVYGYLIDACGWKHSAYVFNRKRAVKTVFKYRNAAREAEKQRCLFCFPG